MFLVLILLLPTLIVLGNFVVALLTPLTAGTDDDMTLIDSVWRLVQGQHLGQDFYDPKGFGLFQVAALLWRLLGPHYYVMRVSADLFALVLVICSAIVAARQLRPMAGLAALFCITVAFVASGPSLYGMNEYFGLTVIYDRPLVAGLLILFVQIFARDLDHQDHRYIDYLLSAFLLNLLFLAKISGLAVGLAILVAGMAFRGPLRRSLIAICMVLLVLVIMIAIEFIASGTSFYGVIKEYHLAAEGRVGPVSVQTVLWFARRLPVLGVVAAMTLYAVSRPSRDGDKDVLWRCLYIIGCYWACQVVLNMSNGSAADLVSLAPGAGVAIVTWTEPVEAGAFWDRLWTKLHLRRLDQVSARQMIPLLIFAAVIGPEAFAGIRALKIDYAISSGSAKAVTVTANDAIRLKILTNTYAGAAIPYLNGGIHAIKALGLNRETIANLDDNNPFPALFLAPDPKGVWVWWDFSPQTNVPVGYKPSWQEVIGDACVVMEPTRPTRYYSAPLIKAVAPHLATAFTLVYQDDIWKVWKRNGGCDGSVTGQVHSSEHENSIRTR